MTTKVTLPPDFRFRINWRGKLILQKRHVETQTIPGTYSTKPIVYRTLEWWVDCTADEMLGQVNYILPDLPDESNDDVQP